MGAINDEDRQRNLYSRIWSSDPAYGTSPIDVENTIVNRVAPHVRRCYLAPNRVRIADFGAGDGRFLTALDRTRLMSHGWGIDVVQPAIVPEHITWVTVPMWEADVHVDYTLSTDALEHLPPDRVAESLERIRNSAPHGFLRISLIEDKYGTARGLHLHESLFSSEAWLWKLRMADIQPSSYQLYFDGLTEAALEVYF